MKKTMLKMAIGIALTAAVGAAQADDFYIDAGKNYAGGGTKAAGPTTTGAKSQFNYHYWSTTRLTDANADTVFSPGDTALGSGGLLNNLAGPGNPGHNKLDENNVTQLTPTQTLNPASSANNGYGGSNWMFGFGWDNLAGVVNASGGIDYTSGEIHFFLFNEDFLPSAVANSDTVPASLAALGGIEVLTFHVTGGGNNAIGQSLNLSGYTSIPAGSIGTEIITGSGVNVEEMFVWAASGITFGDSAGAGITINFNNNQNTDPFYVNGVQSAAALPFIYYAGNNPAGTYNGVGYLSGEHDGSQNFTANVIPEPASLALLGLGLVGLGSMRRRAAV